MKSNFHLSIIAVAFVLTFTACKKDENTPKPSQPASTSDVDISERGTNPDAINSITPISTPGFVYFESNAADMNQVYVYGQDANGLLHPKSIAKTGGTGTGANLLSQGAVTIDEFHSFLYAVNAGDNTVSQFHINADGSLTLNAKISSGGLVPVSVTAFHNMLYVLNAGTSNIQGYYTGGDAPDLSFSSPSLIPNSQQKLSAVDAGAAQISFSPNGAFLIVTEMKSNNISVFRLDVTGAAQPGRIFPASGKSPAGFAFTRDNYMLTADAMGGEPEAGAVTAYLGANTGQLFVAANPVRTMQTSPMHVAVTHYGRFAYVSNTGSNSISGFFITSLGQVYLMISGIPSGGEGPADLVVDASNHYLYVLCTGDHSLREFVRTADGRIKEIGAIVETLPMTSAGLAAFSTQTVFTTSATTAVSTK